MVWFIDIVQGAGREKNQWEDRKLTRDETAEKMGYIGGERRGRRARGSTVLAKKQTAQVEGRPFSEIL